MLPWGGDFIAGQRIYRVDVEEHRIERALFQIEEGWLQAVGNPHCVAIVCQNLLKRVT